MISEIGYFAILLAFSLSLLQATVPLLGVFKNIIQWIDCYKPLAIAQAFLLLLAFLCLVIAFLENDFSLIYVVSNSNTDLPWYYKVSAVWGAHEGSFLLWALIQSLWGFAVVISNNSMTKDFRALVTSILGVISSGFIAFICFTSNPFEKIPFPPQSGSDLNPLLQDIGLIFHPPILYMGYVGFSVTFAFALVSLIDQRFGATWVEWSRRWTIYAWAFLTIGIALGSYWAYYELGWGGYWFWDPVENVSLIPWLLATALIHSQIVTEKRKIFQSWTILLAIACFSMSLLGTFLVRSGILSSVHAFASDPVRGLVILGFLVFIIGGSLSLYVFRVGHHSKQGAGFALLAKETWLLWNNMILAVMGLSVLLGTLYPLIFEVLNKNLISVGPPFFNSVMIPLTCALIFVMGLGPFSNWKISNNRVLLRALFKTSLLTMAIVMLTLFIGQGSTPILAILGVSLGAWIVIATTIDVITFFSGPNRRLKARILLCFPFIGRWSAHFGVGILIFGITMVENFSINEEVRMKPGSDYLIGDLSVYFSAVENIKGANYLSERGIFTITFANGRTMNFFPEKRRYPTRNQTTTEAAIGSRWWTHYYFVLGESLSSNDWSVRISIKPFISWIWGGAIFIAVGGFFGAIGRSPKKNADKVLVAV